MRGTRDILVPRVLEQHNDANTLSHGMCINRRRKKRNDNATEMRTLQVTAEGRPTQVQAGARAGLLKGKISCAQSLSNEGGNFFENFKLKCKLLNAKGQIAGIELKNVVYLKICIGRD